MSLSDHISGLGRAPILRAISRMPFPAGAYRASRAGADLFPFAGPSALFSDAVMRRFRLRPATTGRGTELVGFASCNIRVLHDGKGSGYLLSGKSGARYRAARNVGVNIKLTCDGFLSRQGFRLLGRLSDHYIPIFVQWPLWPMNLSNAQVLRRPHHSLRMSHGNERSVRKPTLSGPAVLRAV